MREFHRGVRVSFIYVYIHMRTYAEMRERRVSDARVCAGGTFRFMYQHQDKRKKCECHVDALSTLSLSLARRSSLPCVVWQIRTAI
jgi:hypothetical protein